MNDPINISILALAISLASLIWSIFTYVNDKRTKLYISVSQSRQGIVAISLVNKTSKAIYLGDIRGTIRPKNGNYNEGIGFVVNIGKSEIKLKPSKTFKVCVSIKTLVHDDPELFSRDDLQLFISCDDSTHARHYSKSYKVSSIRLSEEGEWTEGIVPISLIHPMGKMIR
jgi:hypothetical protein